MSIKVLLWLLFLLRPFFISSFYFDSSPVVHNAKFSVSTSILTFIELNLKLNNLEDIYIFVRKLNQSMQNEGLKIIALKPLNGCTPKFLKVLRPEKFYYFFQNYTIKAWRGEEEVISNDIMPAHFYNQNPKVNICAIVGKNGSGKSTIVELLYVGLYNLAKSLKLLDKKDEDGNYYEFETDIKFDLYISFDGFYYKIRFDNLKPEIFEFNHNGKGYKDKKVVTGKKKLEQLFYTIAINYSHYSLNSEEIGPWVKALFHKNDAYQTPIVLNPFRDKGDIKINIENYLVRSRLLANILVYGFGNPEETKRLLNNKIPTKFVFELDENKFRKNQRGRVSFEFSNNYGHRVFPVLFEIFFGDNNFKPEDNYLNTFAKEYIIQKMRSIVNNYKHYHLYTAFYTKKASKRLYAYISALKADRSHITFKLRQAINFLRFSFLQKNNLAFRENIDSISRSMADILREFPDLEPIEIVPPSFIKVDIEFSNSHDNLSKLSSGEKQKIYSISSLIYHLRNIDSAHFNKKISATAHSRALIQYHYVNIIFDEIELYYHPEFQRIFVNDIVQIISKAKFSNIKGLNIILITHSPFILSDIPKESVMFLELNDGFSQQKKAAYINTFAANIHELLATNFFLNESLMGEFSRIKIQDAITWCQNKNMLMDSEQIKKLIALIDEPIIKFKLTEMFAEKMGENVESARLNAQRDYITNRLNELNNNDTN